MELGPTAPVEREDPAGARTPAGGAGGWGEEGQDLRLLGPEGFSQGGRERTGGGCQEPPPLGPEGDSGGPRGVGEVGKASLLGVGRRNRGAGWLRGGGGVFETTGGVSLRARMPSRPREPLSGSGGV